MKKNQFKKVRSPLTLLLVLFLLLGNLLSAQGLLYYVDLCSFYNGENQPYIEFYMDVDAQSVQFLAQESGSFSANIQVELEVKNMESNEVAYEKKFELLSPVIKDSSRQNRSFGIMDIRRVNLQVGKYVLTGLLKDGLLADAKQYKFELEFEVEKQILGFSSLSEIEFIQSLKKTNHQQVHSKHGFDILPLVTNGNYLDADSLKFYLESYHTDLESPEIYFVNAYISLANSSTKIAGYQKVFRMSSQPLGIISNTIDISKLPSQTYYLNVDLFNKMQEPIAHSSKKFFVANSRVASSLTNAVVPFDEHFTLNEEELDYYLRTLYYVSTNTERDFAKALKTTQEKQNYFTNYWSKRKKNVSDSPAKPFEAYKNRIEYANQKFKASHIEGWRTDRGRILLTHGPPNDIQRFPSSNAKHPYEIWSFNKIKTQANVKFVFYNPNEAIGDFTQLHSNLLGESSNPRWQYDVVRTVVNNNNLDNNKVFDDDW